MDGNDGARSRFADEVNQLLDMAALATDDDGIEILKSLNAGANECRVGQGALLTVLVALLTDLADATEEPVGDLIADLRARLIAAAD